MMSYSIGDGMVTLALADGIVGYVWVKNRTRQIKIQAIHQERMTAMEKGIPLPELPLEPVSEPREPDQRVLPILGIVLATLAVGTMIVLHAIAPPASHGFWVAPLPLAFLGVGLLAFHILKGDPGR